MKKYGLNFHFDSFLCPSGFMAIVLFGHIFCQMSEKELEHKMEFEYGKRFVNHERIHVLQANSFKTKWLGFYILYILYWIRNLFLYNPFSKKPYYNIPFEREAYAEEGNYDLNESDWKKYK